MTMAKEFESLWIKPPASFFSSVDEEKPGKGYKAKKPPQDVIAQKTAIIKAAAAELNARRQEESFNRVLDALRNIGRPSNATEICMESRTISEQAARTAMAKLYKKGVLIRHVAAGNYGKRWSYAYWFNQVNDAISDLYCMDLCDLMIGAGVRRTTSGDDAVAALEDWEAA